MGESTYQLVQVFFHQQYHCMGHICTPRECGCESIHVKNLGFLFNNLCAHIMKRGHANANCRTRRFITSAQVLLSTKQQRKKGNMTCTEIGIDRETFVLATWHQKQFVSSLVLRCFFLSSHPCFSQNDFGPSNLVDKIQEISLYQYVFNMTKGIQTFHWFPAVINHFQFPVILTFSPGTFPSKKGKPPTAKHLPILGAQGAASCT